MSETASASLSMHDDPYHHLHKESYEQAFNHKIVGWNDLFIVADRRRESLSGSFRFVLDLHDEGLRQGWFKHDQTKRRDWTVPRDCDDMAWQTVNVPSCWNVLKPQWFYFEGSAWYSREIDYSPHAEGERPFIRFGAANYEARIFLNGKLIGSHRGGSTPFCIELTQHIKHGPNQLLVQVDNRRKAERVPMGHTDWFNYGGLYRDVDLFRLPKVYIKDFSIVLKPGSNGKIISISVNLSDPIDRMAHVDITDLKDGITVTIENGAGYCEIGADPQLWCPDRPHLYDVRVRIDGDIINERIGFREIIQQGTKLFLNGQELYLRGICVHEDDIMLGKTSSEADIRRRYAHAKSLNANFLRLSHYPHDERAAQIADEMGFLLWQEIPVYWAIAFDNQDTLDDAENQLLEMIQRDHNRASVIIWGIGNENDDTNSRLHFMKSLAVNARKADPTRLIGAACLINRGEFKIQDRLAEYLDVIGINEYFGWYEPSFEGLKKLLSNSSPEKPVIITETGADARAGNHGPSHELFTEEHQAETFRQQLALVDQAPYIRGFCPWILYDFRSERRQTGIQKGYNLKGLIDADKDTKKIAFDLIASHYAMRAMSEREA